MLTLYYIGATFHQSWRIKRVCHKISEQLGDKSSVTFYSLPPRTEDGYDPALATSELCFNRESARVSDILWLYGNNRGCSLLPTQMLQITPWISFPEAPSWLPFAHNPTPLADAFKNRTDSLHLLLETEVEPSLKADFLADAVHVEEYGKPIAWKIDSHLALLLETDAEHFTKLLITTFLQNNCRINDRLPLLRIESVHFEGKPQPFELLSSHLRKSTRTSAKLNPNEWQKHLADLRSLSVLASQATEFEYKKNRTEGKTGVVQPDLIPFEKAATTGAASAGSPKKAVPVIPIEEVTKVVPLEPEKPQTPSKVPQPSESRSQASITTALPTLSPSKIPINGTTKNVSPSTSVAVSNGHEELTANSTETTKPDVMATQGRFKTTKVPESLVKTTTQSDSAPNQLESTPKKVGREKLPPAIGQPQSPTPTLVLTTSSNASSFDSVATTTTAVSVVKDKPQRPSLQRHKDSMKESKPPNILVYSESATARESIEATLKELLEQDMYTIYTMSPQQVEARHWLDNTALLVVCGAVSGNIGEILVDYFLRGGRVLSLCSDILHYVLPTYRTAEVREHELVQFSYGRWQKVKMMHHIFCYQPSPVKKNFSTDSEDSGHTSIKKPSLQLKDLHGELHTLHVQVLGTEETWNTPSLLLANCAQSSGKAVFSQVHLETSPSQFESDEEKFTILRDNEQTRLEIFADLLRTHLDVDTKPDGAAPAEGTTTSKCVYRNAYFLGRHEAKFELLEKLKGRRGADYVISNSKLTLQFCGKDAQPTMAELSLLPILIHSCPEDFSTVDYFDNLRTAYVGRLVIYAPLIGTAMNVLQDLELMHGLAVLPRQQTAGVGRSNNQWLSPLGCAMFAIQLHIAMSSPLGERLPLLQHIVGAAMVNSLQGHPLYRDLNIGLKWPNDIYAHGVSKIGGLIIKTTLMGPNAIVNIGCGINLDNSKPTTCINDLIKEHNRSNHRNLPLLKYEEFVALMFNEIERLVEQVQVAGNFKDFYDLYYELWLHNEQSISICDKDGLKRNATVVGIDDYGYLSVKLSSGVIETVQPDGNSFDMLKGLIVPKFN